MAYLAGWQGPVLEAEDPYGDGISDESLTGSETCAGNAGFAGKRLPVN